MENKICVKCGNEKEIIEFSKHGIKRNGEIRYDNYCKLCINEKNSSPEKRKEASLRTQKWMKDNPERTKKNRKKYQATIRGTEKYRKYHREHQKKRYNSDPVFKNYMRTAAIKYEKSEKGKQKRYLIAKKWINSLSEDELKAYKKRQSLFQSNTYGKQVEGLHDSYMSKLLVGRVDKSIPNEYIEAKRILVQIQRRLKEISKAG
jgi:hypothetical protein